MTEDLLCQIASRIELAQTVSRIRERTKWAEQLGEWGLTRRGAEPGSTLEADDSALVELLPELDDLYPVSGSAVFCAMAATDNIFAVTSLFPTIASAGKRGRLHAPSFMNLCRTGQEAASRTIWLLSPTSRTARRAHTLALLAKEGYEHSNYFTHERAAEGGVPTHAQRRFDEHEAQTLAKRQIAEVTSKGIGFAGPMNVVAYAADWITANPPAHVPGRLAAFGGRAKVMYSLASGTVHGYKWFTEHLGQGRGETGLFNAMADELFMAVVTTECAVALYEAQCLGTDDARETHYPDRLEPTVAQYAALYPAPQD